MRARAYGGSRTARALRAGVWAHQWPLRPEADPEAPAQRIPWTRATRAARHALHHDICLADESELREVAPGVFPSFFRGPLERALRRRTKEARARWEAAPPLPPLHPAGVIAFKALQARSAALERAAQAGGRDSGSLRRRWPREDATRRLTQHRARPVRAQAGGWASSALAGPGGPQLAGAPALPAAVPTAPPELLPVSPQALRLGDAWGAGRHSSGQGAGAAPAASSRHMGTLVATECAPRPAPARPCAGGAGRAFSAGSGHGTAAASAPLDEAEASDSARAGSACDRDSTSDDSASEVGAAPGVGDTAPPAASPQLTGGGAGAPHTSSHALLRLRDVEEAAPPAAARGPPEAADGVGRQPLSAWETLLAPRRGAADPDAPPGAPQPQGRSRLWAAAAADAAVPSVETGKADARAPLAAQRGESASHAAAHGRHQRHARPGDLPAAPPASAGSQTAWPLDGRATHRGEDTAYRIRDGVAAGEGGERPSEGPQRRGPEAPRVLTTPSGAHRPLTIRGDRFGEEQQVRRA